MLFREEREEGPFMRTQPAPISKREKFRKEIRQNCLRARFGQVRRQLVQELNGEELGATVRTLMDQFQEEEFRRMVALLESNGDSVEFSEQMVADRLEGLLADLLLRSGDRVGLEGQTQLVTALSHLTFFSDAAALSLAARDDLVDHLRVRIDALHMDDPAAMRFFNQAASLLMNIASNSDSNELHTFLAESDLALVFNRQLAKTILPARSADHYYRELVSEARDYTLRMFKNVVHGLEERGAVAAQLVAGVLRDEENLMAHPHRTFRLLAQGLACKDFWPALMALPDAGSFFIQVCQSLDDIQGRCLNQDFLNDPAAKLTPQERLDFYGAVCFLNELYYESEDHDLSFLPMIENMLNGYMLAQFIMEAVEESEQGAHEGREEAGVSRRSMAISGIRLVWHLSKTYEVTADQLIVVRPADDPLALLRTLMSPQLLAALPQGRYCLQILAALLVKDRLFLPKLMELGIMDKLRELLEGRLDNQLLTRALELATEMLKAAQALQEESRVYGLFAQKGIVKAVEKSLDHPERVVYVKAEEFMEAAAEERKRNPE